MCLRMKRKFLWTWSRSNVILGFIFLFLEHSRLNLSQYLLKFFSLQCYININERFWTHFAFCFFCCTGQLTKWQLIRVMMRLDQEKDKDYLSDRVTSNFLWHLWQIGELLSWHYWGWQCQTKSNTGHYSLQSLATFLEICFQ